MEPLLPDLKRKLAINGKWEYLIFMSIGMGSSWGLINALYLELPFLESTQPEGIRLAAWMGIASTFAAGMSLLINCCGVMNSLPGYKATLLFILINIFLYLLMASTWWITIRGLSVSLFLGTFGAAMVGNLQFMILLPWVSSNFPPKSTNALMSGSSFMSFICVVLQLLQSPGYRPRFSPTLYLIILALPSFLSIRCILLVERCSKAKEGSRNVEPTRQSLCPSWYLRKVLKYNFIVIWSAMLSW